MTRHSLLLLLIALGLLGWLAVRMAGDAGPSPMVPLTPARALAQPRSSPLAPATGVVSAVGPSQRDLGEPTTRSEATLPGGTTAAACVDVRVEQVLANNTRRLPGVDVALRTGDTVLWARTDAMGRAEFECRGGDGQQATVSCALGPGASVTMCAGAPAVVLLTIAPRVLVRGSVVDASGAAVGGASIVMLPWPAAGADAAVPSRIGASAADGTYEVGLGIGGRIGAVHRVRGPSAMYAVIAPTASGGAPPIVTMPLVLLSVPGQLTGIVRDANGRPVAGAELEFRSACKAPPGAELPSVPQRVRSEQDGRYVATHLLPGAIAYGVRARGHGSRQGRLQLEAGRTAQADIDLPPPCELTGSVRNPDGSPAAAALVQVGPDDAFLGARTNAAADGTFRLRDLAPGQAALAASLPRKAGCSARRATTVLDVRVDGPNEWHAVLSSEDDVSNLRGRLVTAQRRALVGWRVVARPVGGGQDVAVTATDGLFRFNLRPPGGSGAPTARLLVDLRAYAPGKGVTGFADAVLRGVDAAAGLVDFVVTNTAPGRIVARVVTNNGAAVPASVGCYHHERDEYFRFQARDDGVVQRDDVPPGTIDLLFEHPGHASAPRREIAIAADATHDLGEIVLGVGGALFGSVHGPGGSVPDTCELIVIAQGADGIKQRFFANYNAGTYRFPTLPTGSHALLVQPPGLAAARFSISIEAGVDKQQDVALLTGMQRRLRIVVPEKAPRTIGLALSCPGQEIQWLANLVAAGDPGTRREIEAIAWMGPGSYEVVAWGGDWIVHEPVTFAAGLEDEVRLELHQK